MSITDELRKYAARYRSSHDAWSGIAGDLDNIADRIDEAHKHAIAYVDDRDPETMAENGWIRLPIDAEGDPIHVGDSVEIIGGEYGAVVAIELCENGGWNVSMRPAGWDTPTLFAAESVRHYKPQTVEDVLREFAEKVTDSQIPGVHPTYEEAIAEYAAKLRLRSEDE